MGRINKQSGFRRNDRFLFGNAEFYVRRKVWDSLMIFWKEMIKGLYEKQLLSEKSYSCLQEFLDTEECKKILSVVSKI